MPTPRTTPDATSSITGEDPRLTSLLARAVERSTCTILITDPTGIIEYVNPRFCELTGYSHEEVIGLTPRILRSGNTADSVYTEMWQTISEGREWRGEIQNKKKNGELYWESLIIIPVKDDEGRTRHFLAIEDDITERRVLEEKLHVTVEQLTRSNTELEQFSSIVAHDLQGPLMSIMAAVTFVLEQARTSLPPDAVQMLEIAEHAARRASAFTKSLLAYSRVGGAFRPEPLSLDEIAQAAQENLSARIHELSAEIDARDLPWVSGDRPLLIQLFQNLIENSLKHCSAHPPRVSLYAKDDASQWCICVHDNGDGIEHEDIERIFQPFYRAATAHKNAGWGIGLATCKKIVTLHGGKIWAESRLGHGASFFVTLPKAESPSTTA